MNTINKKTLGLTLGLFFGLVHAVWSILVWAGVVQPLLNWILSMHHFQMVYDITEFDFWTALLLVIITFVVGYIGGWVFAALWNWMNK